MNYKNIIKSRKIRLAILEALRFIPDNYMLKVQYRIKMGRKLNLKNPQRFSEKLQWYKINYCNPIMHRCVDKFEVREYVKEKNLEEILVKLYGKYEKVEDIQWEKLPDSFVIKTTNGGGGLNVVICKDKSKLNLEELSQKLVCQKIKPKTGGREWAYYGLPAGIIIEELLVDDENPAAGIKDYKVFCYNGKAKYIIVDTDRYIGHKRNFYDTEWNDLQVSSDCPMVDRKLDKPKNLGEMLRIAEKLSNGFPYVRVDLYNVAGKIYFGELTFYPWSGYVQFEPDEFDYILGSKFDISNV